MGEQRFLSFGRSMTLFLVSDWFPHTSSKRSGDRLGSVLRLPGRLVEMTLNPLFGSMQKSGRRWESILRISTTLRWLGLKSWLNDKPVSEHPYGFG